MNLKKLFDLQRELDERINQEHPPEPGEDRLAKKILALQVELGECANEWRGFKFWSKDQEPKVYIHDVEEVCRTCNGVGVFKNQCCDDCEGTGDLIRNPLLEEYVDCLHFILSIGLYIGKDQNCLKGMEWVTNQKPLKIHIINRFTELMSRVGGITYDDYYSDMLWYFIDLGFMLGFTWVQIEEAYFSKNKVNHERQTQGY